MGRLRQEQSWCRTEVSCLTSSEKYRKHQVCQVSPREMRNTFFDNRFQLHLLNSMRFSIFFSRKKLYWMVCSLKFYILDNVLHTTAFLNFVVIYYFIFFSIFFFFFFCFVCLRTNANTKYLIFKAFHVQSNFNGSNTFGTMKISSRQG